MKGGENAQGTKCFVDAIARKGACELGIGRLFQLSESGSSLPTKLGLVQVFSRKRMLVQLLKRHVDAAVVSILTEVSNDLRLSDADAERRCGAST